MKKAAGPYPMPCGPTREIDCLPNEHCQPRLIGMIPEFAMQFESENPVSEKNLATVAAMLL
jgi:hypothetical protein